LMGARGYTRRLLPGLTGPVLKVPNVARDYTAKSYDMVARRRHGSRFRGGLGVFPLFNALATAAAMRARRRGVRLRGVVLVVTAGLGAALALVLVAGHGSIGVVGRCGKPDEAD